MGSVKKINKNKMAFKQRENIVNYLDACKKLGMRDTDCFVSQDLFEGDNMVAVIDQIYALGALSRKTKGFEGPYFGVKFADENKREFTEEQIKAGKKFVPLQNAGSIAVDKGKGTDKIVKYGLVGQDMGESVDESGVSQQNAGSIAIEKEKGTDHIVKYGKVGQDMGKSTGGTSQQNAGSIAIEKGTDHIVRYGKVGQELGESVGGTSQQNEGSVERSKGKKLDNVSRALN